MTKFDVTKFNGLLAQADSAVLQLQEYVVACPGTTREVIRGHVVAFVAKATGTKPHASRKGGALTFAPKSAEVKRVDYLLTLIYSTGSGKKAKKTDPIAKFASAVKAAKAAGLTKAQAVRAFERAWN